MKRMADKAPRPADAGEIELALAENGAEAGDCRAAIRWVDSDGFKRMGWTAEVQGADGAALFTTLAFPALEALTAALGEVGLADWTVLRADGGVSR